MRVCCANDKFGSEAALHQSRALFINCFLAPKRAKVPATLKDAKRLSKFNGTLRECRLLNQVDS